MLGDQRVEMVEGRLVGCALKGFVRYGRRIAYRTLALPGSVDRRARYPGARVDGNAGSERRVPAA